MSTRVSDNLSLPVAVIVAAVIIGGSIIFASLKMRGGGAETAIRQIPPATQGVQTVTPAQPAAKTVDIKAVKSAGAKIVGNTAAPITVAYWYDYNCGFCKGAEEQLIAPLMTEYVKTGKIRVMFKDLQFLRPESTKIGLAARAVWEVAPSKFYEWHDLMFQNQGKLELATNDKLLALTSQAIGKAGADRVIALMASKSDEYQKLLDADKAEGSVFGIRSTPSFIIGSQLVTGLKSYAEVKQAVEAALKNK